MLIVVCRTGGLISDDGTGETVKRMLNGLPGGLCRCDAGIPVLKLLCKVIQVGFNLVKPVQCDIFQEAFKSLTFPPGKRFLREIQQQGGMGETGTGFLEPGLEFRFVKHQTDYGESIPAHGLVQLIADITCIYSGTDFCGPAVFLYGCGKKWQSAVFFRRRPHGFLKRPDEFLKMGVRHKGKAESVPPFIHLCVMTAAETGFIGSDPAFRFHIGGGEKTVNISVFTQDLQPAHWTLAILFKGIKDRNRIKCVFHVRLLNYMILLWAPPSFDLTRRLYGIGSLKPAALVIH